jgi:acetyl-CoA synthetase
LDSCGIQVGVHKGYRVVMISDFPHHALHASGFDPVRVEALAKAWSEASETPLGRWGAVSKALRPDDDFAAHRILYQACAGTSELPIWWPSGDQLAASNVASLLARHGSPESLHRFSVDQPEAYWSGVLNALGVRFDQPPQRMLDGVGEAGRWLPAARLNIAVSCFARPAEASAIVYAGPDGAIQRISVGDLERRACRVAAALRTAGFAPGDAIAIDLPMTAESVVIYLGIVLMGGAVVSIADSFAPAEIATRLALAEARAVFTQDVILRGDKSLPLYERVVAAGAPRTIVLAASGALKEELRAGDMTYRDLLATVPENVSFEPYICAPESPTNILFSSGTTGDPKAIPWSHITPIKSAADGWAHHDIRVGDVVVWPTNLGWMMGPWLIYASLLNGATIGLFEGSPLGRPFGAFVRDAEVTLLGVVPSLVRAWRSSDCMAGLDWSSIRCFSSTGEASNAEDMHWLTARAGYKPVIEYCGGTEIGGGYVCGSMAQAQLPAAFSTPAMGTELLLLDDVDQPALEGEVALVAPMFGASNTLLNRDHHEVYYAGMPAGPNGEVLRRHGDQMLRTADGFYRAQGRVDDTMNLGGIKVSSAELERACNRHPKVRECAAIAVEPPGGGPSRLVLVAVLDSAITEPDLKTELQVAIRRELNPLFKIHDVVLAQALPRTASNKVMRRVLRADYRGEG